MSSKEPPAGISPELWEQWTSGSGYDYSTLEPVPEPATLRDQFAMAALTGLLSNAEAVNSDGWSWRTGTLTGDAYKFADDMLEARKQDSAG